MYKIFVLLLLPLFVFAKFQVTTYFPLESFLVKKIGQNEIRIKEVFNRYIPKFTNLSKSDISKLASVKIYFHFGLENELKYASILKKSNPELIIVDMSKGVKKIDNNPYIWMDPFLLRIVAKNIYESLIDIDKFNKNFYEENYHKLLDELDKTFLRVKEIINKNAIFNIFVYDDYWFYYARRFRINVYKREKNYLKTDDIKEISTFSQKKLIKKLLINEGEEYSLAQSLANNCNLSIIENNPFSEQILFNQVLLIQKIAD